MSNVDRLIHLLQFKNQSPPIKNISNRQLSTKHDVLISIQKAKRQPWKTSIEQNKIEIKPLRNRILDNWQISRINNHLSPRSFEKNSPNIKVSIQNKTFMKCSSKDKEGHLPYLYESKINKIGRLRSKLQATDNRCKQVSVQGYFGLLNLGVSRSEVKIEKSLSLYE